MSVHVHVSKRYWCNALNRKLVYLMILVSDYAKPCYSYGLFTLLVPTSKCMGVSMVINLRERSRRVSNAWNSGPKTPQECYWFSLSQVISDWPLTLGGLCCKSRWCKNNSLFAWTSHCIVKKSICVWLFSEKIGLTE